MSSLTAYVGSPSPPRAGVAAGVGAAYGGGVSLSVLTGMATGTGAAGTTGATITSHADVAIGTGVAYTASVASNDPQWANDLRTALTGVTYANTYTVPTGAGYTDGTDCAANVAAFIAGKADGASASVHNRILFPAGYTYTFSGIGGDATHGGLVIAARHNLTIDATGATFQKSGEGIDNYANAFRVGDSTYIRLLLPAIVGEMADMFTDAAQASVNEYMSGVQIRGGCSYIEVTGGSMSAIRGWGVIISGDMYPAELSHHLWIHGIGAITGTEMFFATVGGTDVIIEDCGPCDGATWGTCIDLEPNTYRGDVRRYLIQRNTFDRFGFRGAGHNEELLTEGLGYTGPPYHVCDDIILRDNTVLRGSSHAQGGIGVVVVGAGNKARFTITGNYSYASTVDQAAGGMMFVNVDTLTVTGNTQGLTGHAALVMSDVNPSGVHTLTPNVT